MRSDKREGMHRRPAAATSLDLQEPQTRLFSKSEVSQHFMLPHLLPTFPQSRRQAPFRPPLRSISSGHERTRAALSRVGDGFRERGKEGCPNHPLSNLLLGSKKIKKLKEETAHKNFRSIMNTRLRSWTSGSSVRPYRPSSAWSISISVLAEIWTIYRDDWSLHETLGIQGSVGDDGREARD